MIAHRTSPTNIGMYLVATVAAHEFGWIGLPEVCERVEACLAHAREAAAASRPFPQLDRDDDAALARAAVCIDGRQRQPRRLPDCAVVGRAHGARATRPSARNAWRGVADDVALLRRAIERADRKRPSTSVNVVAVAGGARGDRCAARRPRSVGGAVRWPELERLATDVLDMARVIAEEGDASRRWRCRDQCRCSARRHRAAPCGVPCSSRPGAIAPDPRRAPGRGAVAPHDTATRRAARARDPAGPAARRAARAMRGTPAPTRDDRDDSAGRSAPPAARRCATSSAMPST